MKCWFLPIVAAKLKFTFPSSLYSCSMVQTIFKKTAWNFYYESALCLICTVSGQAKHLIEVSPSEPHGSDCIAHVVCIYACLDRPFTINFISAHSNISQWWTMDSPATSWFDCEAYSIPVTIIVWLDEWLHVCVGIPNRFATCSGSPQDDLASY